MVPGYGAAQVCNIWGLERQTKPNSMCHVSAKTGCAFVVSAVTRLSSRLPINDCAFTSCIGADDPQLPSECQGCQNLQLCSAQSIIAFVVMQAAQHMEWVDDVQMFMRKGAATPVAYHMAAPLLADIASSLQVCLLCRPLQTRTAHHALPTQMACNSLSKWPVPLCECCRPAVALHMADSHSRHSKH